MYIVSLSLRVLSLADIADFILLFFRDARRGDANGSRDGLSLRVLDLSSAQMRTGHLN